MKKYISNVENGRKLYQWLKKMPTLFVSTLFHLKCDTRKELPPPYRNQTWDTLDSNPLPTQAEPHLWGCDTASTRYYSIPGLTAHTFNIYHYYIVGFSSDRVTNFVSLLILEFLRDSSTKECRLDFQESWVQHQFYHD